MKTLKVGLFLLLCLDLCGCACHKMKCASIKPSSGKSVSRLDDSASAVKLLRITASVDGSGRIIFTRQNVHYEHKHWSPPWNVTFNGEPWSNLDSTPTGWRDLSEHLDLTKAWISKRTGRDVLVLEQTREGFDLYLDDSPNGAADYEVIIAIPQRD